MSTSHTVYHLLKERLLSREFEPGAHLKEAALAASLGVSRTPLRQALHRLAAEGLLEQSPNQGVRVPRWSIKDVEEIFELRQLLEPHAAALAARFRTQRHVDALHAAARDVARHTEDGSKEAVLLRSEANTRFHNTVLEAAGNERLAAIVAGVVQFAMVSWTYRSFNLADMRRSTAHHFELADAIAARDEAWARAVMTAHIAAAHRAVQNALSNLEEPQGLNRKGNLNA
ncbi:MAG TPA: GntR family transcriptional regulator [Burkholderiaceae bacterium]|nr:GntR family transcriptional regulator [Burkholderiaceae bacterium]